MNNPYMNTASNAELIEMAYNQARRNAAREQSQAIRSLVNSARRSLRRLITPRTDAETVADTAGLAATR